MSALTHWPDDATADYGASQGYVKRAHPRIQSPLLRVGMRGRDYPTSNWSLGGMLIKGYDGTLNTGDTFEIETIRFGSSLTWPVMIQARVLRRGGRDGTELAAEFKTLNMVAFDILESIMLRRPKTPNAA